MLEKRFGTLVSVFRKSSQEKGSPLGIRSNTASIPERKSGSTTPTGFSLRKNTRLPSLPPSKTMKCFHARCVCAAKARTVSNFPKDTGGSRYSSPDFSQTLPNYVCTLPSVFPIRKCVTLSMRGYAAQAMN